MQRLYRLGARKVIMFEIGPIGCIPSLTKQLKHNGLCAEEYNNLAVIFNNQLSDMLKNLTSTLRGSALILGHAHWLGFDAVTNPSTYGNTVKSLYNILIYFDIFLLLYIVKCCYGKYIL